MVFLSIDVSISGCLHICVGADTERNLHRALLRHLLSSRLQDNDDARSADDNPYLGAGTADLRAGAVRVRPGTPHQPGSDESADDV